MKKSLASNRTYTGADDTYQDEAKNRNTAMMWKEWTKYGESENGKNYELMAGSDVQVLFVVRLYKLETSSSMWMAGISTFNPSAGEYVLYEDVFSSLEKAEEKAWEKAQEVVRQFNQ